MPASYVKAYVRRQKNDAADAAAICAAVNRPAMRFVPVKTVEQQAALMLHRSRDLLVRQRTQLINALRAHLAELGLVAQTGVTVSPSSPRSSRDELIACALPTPMRQALQVLLDQLAALQEQIGTLDRAIHTQHRANDTSRRLETIPGIGVIGATVIAATVTDPSAFKSGRDLAAWIGLVPRQHSTGGKEKLGSISKQGDRYLRRLLIIGATAVIRQARRHPEKHRWIMNFLAKMPAKRSPSRLPTRWRASPGRSWPRAGTIERRRLRQPPEGARQGEREAWRCRQ